MISGSLTTPGSADRRQQRWPHRKLPRWRPIVSQSILVPDAKPSIQGANGPLSPTLSGITLEACPPFDLSDSYHKRIAGVALAGRRLVNQADQMGRHRDRIDGIMRTCTMASTTTHRS